MDNLENILEEVFVRIHKCPWYKTIFKKKPINQFTCRKESDGIGTSKIIHCNRCGEEFDITDYSLW